MGRLESPHSACYDAPTMVENRIRVESLERFILWAGAAALLVPALYVPQFLYPYIFGRAIFFHFVVELMAVAWVLLLIRQPERYKPRLHWSGIFFAIFLGINLLASLFGADPGRSIWGTELRMTGWFTFAHAFFYFVVLSSVVVSEREWRKLFSVSSLVVGGMAALSFGERLSPAIRAAIHGGVRVQSTTGNPIYFASVLLFGIAITAWLSATSRGRNRFLWTALAAVQVVALYFTEVRGAILAFFITFLILCISAAVAGRTPAIKRGAALITLFMIVAGVGIYLARESKFIRSSSPIQRVINIDLSSGTSETRLIMWQIALRGIQARPILGWGMENFNVVFDRFYRPELLQHGFYETVSDKPHNALLEIGVASGTLGLLVYSAFVITLVTALFRGYRAGRLDGATSLSFGGAFLAYQIQNLFAFDTPNSLLMLALVLGFLNVRLKPFPAEARVGSLTARAPSAALTLLAVAVLPFVVVGNISPLSASMNAALAQGVAGRDAILWKEPALHAIRGRGPHVREIRVATTRDLLNWEGTGRIPPNIVRDVLDSFIAEMRRSVSSRSVTFQERFMLAQLLVIRGEYFDDAQAFHDAESELDAAATLSPGRQAVPFLLGKLYLMTERPEEAVRVLREVLSQDPSVAEAHWFYGLGLIATGKRTEGIAALEESQSRGRGLSKTNEIKYLIDVYAEDQRYEPIVPLYERLIELDPTSAELHASLAATYAKLGKSALAIIEAQRAVELDPSFAARADAVIKSLGPGE